jgi:hypothetical protein
VVTTSACIKKVESRTNKMHVMRMIGGRIGWQGRDRHDITQWN